MTRRPIIDSRLCKSLELSAPKELLKKKVNLSDKTIDPTSQEAFFYLCFSFFFAYTQ